MGTTPRDALAGCRSEKASRLRRRVASAAAAAATLASALIVAACSTAKIAGPLPGGVWGGAQANLTVYADSATLDLACAAGRIQADIVTGTDGSFDLSGFYAPVVGPIRVGGPDWQPARFHGTRSGDDLTLTVVPSSGTAVGPLELHRGTVGTFPRCL